MLEEINIQENAWKPASCEIEWRIENFCLAIHSDRYRVLSDDFILRSYNNFTKWRMDLVLKDDIFFVIKRLNDHGPDFVSLNWQVSLIAGEKKFEPYTFTSNSFIFSENSERSISLKPVIEALKYLSPFEDDTITIQCLLIVLKNEESTHRSQLPCFGFRNLSYDLKNFRELHDYFLADVILRVGQKSIKAHKAVLCRNKVLESYIEKAEDGVIELPNFDYEALDKFVNFLYSGNIDDILSEPSIFMIRCLLHFDKELLNCYFVLEELKMLTRIKVKTLYYNWSVKDFPTEGYATISSSPIWILNMDTTWMLTMSLEPKRNRPNEDRISLLAEIIGGELPDYFCLEFAIQNEAGAVFHPRRLIKYNRCYDNVEFKTSIKKCDLNPSVNIHGNIKVLFKIRTFDDGQERSIESRNLNLISSTSISSYDQLSSDLSELLKTKKYCDVIIKCGNKLYYAHRCILAARSIEFLNIFNRMSPQNNIPPVDISEQVEEDAWEYILNYLYSGAFHWEEGTFEKIERIRDSADIDALDIPSLFEECNTSLRVMDR